METTAKTLVAGLEEQLKTLEDMQRATLNILDDFNAEKHRLEEVQHATLNILEDFDSEKVRLQGVQRGALNILEDFDDEKKSLLGVQRATLNILEDFHTEKAHLEQSQRAFLNILDDIDVEKEKVASGNQQLEATNQALRLSETRFRSLLESAPNAIVAVNSTGRIVHVNAQTEILFGYARAELLGQQLEILVPDPMREVHISHRQAYMASPRIRPMAPGLDLFARRKDGSEFPAAVNLSPLETSEGTLVISIIADITARKQAEREIKELNKTLEARAVELQALNKELEAFTYSVAHDLRAPLRRTDGFAQLLLEEYNSGLSEEAQHYLRRVQEGTRQMGQLVDDLLNLARLGRKEVKLQVTGLSSLIQEVVAELKREAEGRDIEWRIQPLPFVECDPALMKVVFSNLLSNAVKYTRPRPQAVIEVGTAERDGQSIIFVRDNGVGFSMKYADKLFGVFQRLHRVEDFEGTGVGLATVRRIVHKHGGEVWAEGELDKGACFYFALGMQPGIGPEVSPGSGKEIHAAR